MDDFPATAVVEPSADNEDALARRLRDAVAGGGLALHYQPIVELPLGSLRGVEALARWEDPVLGTVPPDRFIPVAERTGLIIDLGRWVLRTACRDATQWNGPVGRRAPSVALNVSPLQLAHHTFVDDVKQVLQETGLSADRLRLEITETAGITDIADASRRLRELRALGVRVSLDDFGTGYASLTMLQALPLDIVKIDRSFITDVAGNATDAVLVRLIVDAAHALGRKVCAEGVETAEQARQVMAIGADMAQGWFYGRPEPDSEHLRARMVDLIGDTVQAYDAEQKLLLGGSDELVIITSAAGRIRYASSNSIDIIGRPSSELIGSRLDDHLEVLPADESLVPFGSSPAALAGQVTHRVRRPDDSDRWVTTRSQLLRDDDDSVREVLSVSHDVTEMMLARIALRDSEQQFTRAFDGALFGMALSTLDGRLIRVNRAFADLLGYEPDDLLAHTVASITPEGYRTDDEQNTTRLADGEVDQVDVTKMYLHCDGRHIGVHVRAVIIRSGSEQPRILAHILPDPGNGRLLRAAV